MLEWRASGLRRRMRDVLGEVRLRILGGLVVLIGVADVAAVMLERQILLEQLDAEVESSLAQEIEEIRTLAGGRDPNTGKAFGTNVAAIFDTFLRRNIPSEGEALFTFVDGNPYQTTQTPPHPLHEDPELVTRLATLNSPDRGELMTPAGPVRYRAIPLPLEGDPRGVFVVANFLAQEREEIATTVRVGALVAFPTLVGAAALSWIVAGRVLKPVRLLANTAHSISETDLTRRIAVEGSDEIAQVTRAFNAMLNRLEEAFTSQRAFLDDVSHELRTPIAIIRGYLEVLDDDPRERAATVEVLVNELDLMTRLVDGLVLLAKAERPGFLEPEPIDLAAFTVELHTKSLALALRRWKLESVAEGKVLGDHHRLSQAMMNIIRNAARHTADHAVIAISSSVTDQEARLSVRDTGTGIDPADHGRIFGRFVRLHNGPGRSERTGLGLAIVKGIVEAHGGRIEVDSRLGAGATFTVILPLADSKRLSSPPAS